MLILKILFTIQIICLLILVVSFKFRQITEKHVSIAGQIFFASSVISTIISFFKFII